MDIKLAIFFKLITFLGCIYGVWIGPTWAIILFSCWFFNRMCFNYIKNRDKIVEELKKCFKN